MRLEAVGLDLSDGLFAFARTVELVDEQVERIGALVMRVFRMPIPSPR